MNVLKLKKKIFVLGTAQLNSNYGITNSNSIVSKKESYKILDYAWEKGIRHFDTAPTYKSQKILGEFIKINNLEKEINIFSKISKIRLITNLKNQISNEIDKNINELKVVPKVNFLHDRKNIKNLIHKNINLKKISPTLGFSIYNPDEISKTKKNLFYQFPSNFLDNRFDKNFIFKNFRVARSLFLQGILISKINKKPIIKKKRLLNKFQKKFFNICEENKIDPIEFNLSYMLKKKHFDYFIIGVNSKKNLAKILRSNFNYQTKYNVINYNLFENIRSLNKPYNW